VVFCRLPGRPAEGVTAHQPRDTWGEETVNFRIGWCWCRWRRKTGSFYYIFGSIHVLVIPERFFGTIIRKKNPGDRKQGGELICTKYRKDESV